MEYCIILKNFFILNIPYILCFLYNFNDAFMLMIFLFIQFYSIIKEMMLTFLTNNRRINFDKRMAFYIKLSGMIQDTILGFTVVVILIFSEYSTEFEIYIYKVLFVILCYMLTLLNFAIVSKLGTYFINEKYQKKTKLQKEKTHVSEKEKTHVSEEEITLSSTLSSSSSL